MSSSGESPEARMAFVEWMDEQYALEEEQKSEIEDAREYRNCEVCGYPLVQKHRLVPGKCGGCYTWENVAFLCPTHHRLAHLFKRAEVANKEGRFDEVSSYDIDVFHKVINGVDDDFVEWWEEHKHKTEPPMLSIGAEGDE